MKGRFEFLFIKAQKKLQKNEQNQENFLVHLS